MQRGEARDLPLWAQVLVLLLIVALICAVIFIWRQQRRLEHEIRKRLECENKRLEIENTYLRDWRIKGELRRSLSIACAEGNLSAVSELLNSGVDVNQGTSADPATRADPATPLLNACFFGHLEIARLLLDKGADVNRTNSEGVTLLHYVADKGNLEMATMLLDYGCDVDRANSYGLTALHSACESDRPEVIKLLLEHGASPEITARPNWPFQNPIKTLLRQWSAATPARRLVVRRYGWEYVAVPDEWTPSNHAKFPASFRSKVLGLCLAWQAPKDVLEKVSVAYHGELGLHR